VRHHRGTGRGDPAVSGPAEPAVYVVDVTYVDADPSLATFRLDGRRDPSGHQHCVGQPCRLSTGIPPAINRHIDSRRPTSRAL
jgi:hypothetical protein